MYQLINLENAYARGGCSTQLSNIEVSVLRGLANGYQSKEIAVDVGRKSPTVEAYIRNLFLKFDARSRAHLVALALCSGILQPSEIGHSIARSG